MTLLVQTSMSKSRRMLACLLAMQLGLLQAVPWRLLSSKKSMICLVCTHFGDCNVGLATPILILTDGLGTSVAFMLHCALKPSTSCGTLRPLQVNTAPTWHAGDNMQPEDLQSLLQQHQTEMQTQLTAVNDKLETWVCQCFTDLRNRIVALVSLELCALRLYLYA